MFENYQYDVNLPIGMNDLMRENFWVCPTLSGKFISTVLDTMKTFANTCIFVKKGKGTAMINLEKFEIKAPCIVQIGSDKFLSQIHVSEDFEASFMVMSKRFVEDLLIIISDSNFYSLTDRFPVINIKEEDYSAFETFYIYITRLSNNVENPYLYNAILHQLSGFFFSIAYKYYLKTKDSDPNNAGSRISDKFLSLVEHNFKQHRFLEFYADELGITTKHLSRTIKKQTGLSAVEWIERITILEAKVELRYTNKTIQQISEDLSFPTQSFFGKYFKKATGLSPKEFRNRPYDSDV